MSQETRPSPKNATSHATAKPARVSALRPRTDLTRVLTSPAGIPVGSPAPLAAPPLGETSSVRKEGAMNEPIEAIETEQACRNEPRSTSSPEPAGLCQPAREGQS